MEPNENSYLTITQAAAALRRNELSPVDITNALLERIEAVDDKLHCFITLTADLAREQAQQQSRNCAREPIAARFTASPSRSKIFT